MIIKEIKEKNVKLASQPIDIKTRLNKYQLATLYEAKRLEKSNVFKCNKQNFIKTKIGFLCNKVGSGKSLIILALLSHINIYLYKSCCNSMISDNLFQSYISKPNFKYNLETNMIVIPHNIAFQWENYIKEHSNFTYQIINKSKDINNLLNLKIKLNDGIIDLDKEQFENLIEKIKDKKILLISSTYFNYFIKTLYNLNLENSLQFNRIVYDEVDTLNIPNNKFLNANFYWFISSNINNLLNPESSYKYVKTGELISFENEQYVRLKYTKTGGILKNGYVKSIFQDLKDSKNKDALFLKCNDDFIDKYLNLPDINFETVYVQNLFIKDVLNRFIDNQTKELINQGDIIGAMNRINCNKTDEKNIIDIFTKKLRTELKDMKLYKEYLLKSESFTESSKLKKIEELNSKIDKKTSDINFIINKVKDISICPIGGNKIKNVAYCSECKNPFESENLLKWLLIKNTCPLCRGTINKDSLYIVKSEDKDKKEENKVYNNKYNAAIDIVLEKLNEKNKKILIFSENIHGIQVLSTLLKNRNIKSDILYGNSETLKKILNEYRNKDLNVLLLNAKNYGSGLNLENSTDLIIMHKMKPEYEEQVIGRAQRPGRKGVLNVWKILYENE